MDESVVKHLEQQQRITTLSQAIREGCKLRPAKCVQAYFQAHAGLRSSCALGAAWEAMYGNEDCPASDQPNAHVAWGVPQKVFREIIRKNDSEKWSREGIANWLEKQGY